MNLEWLDAPADEVLAGIANAERGERPAWVPTWRQMVVHVNNCLMLWYLAIASVAMGVRIDTVQDNRILPKDIRDIVILAGILLVWILASVWLERWSRRPLSDRIRVQHGRASLTALANGFEPKATMRIPFRSLITAGARRAFPRFVGSSGTEFGNLSRNRPHAESWHYMRVKCPVALPHLILDSTATAAVSKHLPVSIARGQLLSLEGDFDDWFRVYAPEDYETDALELLTPDVMTVLTDHASGYSVEMIDDSIVFFSPGHDDFSSREVWMRMAAVLSRVLPPLLANARVYRDDRIPAQVMSRAEISWRAALEDAEEIVVQPARIDERGRRLRVRDRRSGIWALFGFLGWIAALAVLYVVPGIFAMAGLLSIVDGH
ncbi:hypothetical protein [Gulosibacter chungangensis]|nr:hypothetical protein [Gulosibacter chungangensis]